MHYYYLSGKLQIQNTAIPLFFMKAESVQAKIQNKCNITIHTLGIIISTVRV